MRRAAKVFMNNRSQAVRLPKEFQFTTREVFIRKQGGDVILSPRATDWSSYLDEAPASGELMTTARTCPHRSASANAALHAGHRHLFLGYEALQ